MPEARAEMLLAWMELIDFYTLQRALAGLSKVDLSVGRFGEVRLSWAACCGGMAQGP